MKRVSSIFIGTIISLSCLSSVSAQQPVQASNVTLYSVIKHRGEQPKSCINFKIAATGFLRVPCDLRYGSLYAGDELDWFESSTAEGARSVIKDLGEHDWPTAFQCPLADPPAKPH